MKKTFTLGCIGCGNMGGALLQGLAQRFDSQCLRLLGYDHTPSKVEGAGAEICTSIEDLVQQSDILLLGIKPAQVESMLKGLQAQLRPQQVVLSVAAGISNQALAQAVNHICPVVRIMPNLPAIVGKGLFALCLEDPSLSAAQRNLIVDIFQALGEVMELPEKHFAAFTALAGCGPAYQMLFMEGMVNAGIALGLSAAQARQAVLCTCEGSANMALKSQDSLETLRQQVCSPGGITIRAINHMERHAVRGLITEAVFQTCDKSL